MAERIWLVEYQWHDGRYGLEVPAASAAEAMERVKRAAAFGECIGELKFRVPLGAGIFVKIACASQNFLTWIRRLP